MLNGFYYTRKLPLDGIKASITVPWLTDDSIVSAQRNSLRNEADAYSKVPLMFRAIRLRADTLTSVPLYIYEGENEVGQYVFEDSLPIRELLWLSEASTLLRGGAVIVRLRSNLGSELGLQVLNPFSVVIKRDRDGSLLFEQFINGKRFPENGQYWTEDDVLFLRDYSPVEDKAWGVAAASVGMEGAKVRHFLTRFAAQFFESGAMPVTLIAMPPGTDEPEVKRVEGFFKNALTGLKNAWRVLGTKGEVKLETLTPELKSLELDKVGTSAVESIAWAFDIPKTVLTADSANRATAETEYELFISKTIVPRTVYYESILNRFLEPFGQRIQFAPNEMSELQVDERKRAAAFSAYVNAGFTPQLAAAILGIDIPRDFQDFWKGEHVTQRPKLEVATTVKEDDDENDIKDDEADVSDTDEFKADLSRWQRKALKRLRSGGRAAVSFKSSAIPQAIARGISSLLEQAVDESHVKTIFREVGEHYTSSPSPLIVPANGQPQPQPQPQPSMNIILPDSIKLATEFDRSSEKLIHSMNEMKTAAENQLKALKDEAERRALDTEAQDAQVVRVHRETVQMLDRAIKKIDTLTGAFSAERMIEVVRDAEGRIDKLKQTIKQGE